MKDDINVLLSSRQLALKNVQTQLLESAAHATQDTAIEKAQRSTDKDAG